MVDLKEVTSQFEIAYTNYMKSCYFTGKKHVCSDKDKARRSAVYFNLRSFILDCGILTYNDLDLIELGVNASLRQKGFNI